jgi:AcrR family transcriptional regulator
MSTADARERILAAAERCIDRHGIRKTTMDDIASEVGLSRPASTATSPIGTICSSS